MKSDHSLCVPGLGFALGVTWGLGMLFMGLMAHFFNWGNLFVHTMGTVYIGFRSDILGSVLGLIWGFCDGFIGGVIIAWLYNLVAHKCCKS